MEDLIIGAMFIVTVICYTVYKIDCNHVNKPKNNYLTGGLMRNNYKSLGKQKKAKGTKIPPGSKTYDHKLPDEETLKAMFGGKDYKSESGRLSPKQEKVPKPPRKDSE